MHIVFVGNVLPSDIFLKVSKINPSTNNIQLTFLRIFSGISENGIDVVCKNVNIVNLYGSNQTKIPYGSLNSGECYKIQTAGMLNWKPVRGISGMISLYLLLKRIRKRLFKSDRHMDILFLVCNPFSHMVLPVYLIKRRTDKMVNIMLEGLDVRFLRKGANTWHNSMLHAVNQWLFKNNDGIITFCGNSVLRYAPEVPYIELLYAHDHTLFGTGHLKRNDGKFRILCAGALSTCYGLDVVLQSFRLLPNNFELILCGGGDLEIAEMLQHEAEADSRIQFKGLVSRSEVIELERSSDVLLMLRVTNTDYDSYIANYCQPSKLGEYFLSGTPVLATKIPAILDTFDEFLNYTDTDPKTIADTIYTIAVDQEGYYLAKAGKAREFALENCTVDKLGKDVCNFINKLYV